MNSIFSRKFGLVSITVFVMGLIVMTTVYARRHLNKAQKGTGFTIYSKRTLIVTGDSLTPLVKEISVRFQKANGSWKKVATLYDTEGKVYKVATGFGEPGRGVFEVDERNKHLEFISVLSGGHNHAGEDLSKNPEFVREELVLGYKTFVLRFRDSDGYRELFIAPSLRGLTIKSVTVSGNATQVTEPTKIEIGEPPESEFTSLPKYQVDYTLFEKKIAAIEKAGRREAAQQMRKTLQRQKLNK